MGLEPGYLVSKHVKLVRMLKRGGMGSVWIADHLALQTQVAVKFMSGSMADDPASRMKRLGPLPLDEVATILLQTTRVLAKAHQIGIIHRDIKPSNIFLVD